MNESKAIALCLNDRDPRGFEFLVKMYRHEAYFHAVGFLGNAEDAADACQEAFCRAFRAIPTIDKLERFYPWFYTILKNICLNVLQRKKTVRENERSVALEQQVGPVFDPDVLLERQGVSAAVWRAMGELEPKFRELLVLKYVNGLDYQAIADLLHCPRGTVMSRLYHARTAFRRRYIRLQKGGEYD